MSQHAYEVATKACNELGLKLVIYSSNVFTAMEDYKEYAMYHTFFMVSILLTVGNSFKTYYYSSAYDWKHVNFSNVYHDFNYVDPIMLPYLSSSNIAFYSVGNEYARPEKQNIVLNNPISARYLTPCLKNFKKNCGWCFKCKRTLVTADINGNLEKLKESFNIDGYLQCRNAYLCYLIVNKDDPLLTGIYDKFEKNETDLCLQLKKQIPILKKKFGDGPGWMVSSEADLDKTFALKRLAFLYQYGLEENGQFTPRVKPDYQIACKLWEKGFGDGYTDEEYLDYIKCLSKITEKQKDAFDLCIKESKNGKIEFIKLLVQFYHNGVGVEKNDLAAFEAMKPLLNSEQRVVVELLNEILDSEEDVVKAYLINICNELKLDNPQASLFQGKVNYSLLHNYDLAVTSL